MRNFILFFLFFLILTTSYACAQTAPPMGIRDKTPQLKAFVDARIVVSPQQIIQQGTLVIDDGNIIAVGEDVNLPDGAIVYDLNGKTIYPGFVDPYTEYGLKNVGDLYPKKKGRKPVYDSKRTGASSWNDAVHPEKRWVTCFQPDKETAEEWLKLGFTTVQSAKMDGVLRGSAFVALLGPGAPNDLVLKAEASQWASYTKGSSQQEYPSSQMGAIALLRQTFLDADWYRKAQAAYEINPQQEIPEFNTSIEALTDFERQRYLFGTQNALQILRADNLAREFGLDIVCLGGNQEYTRLDQVVSTRRTLILPVDYPDIPEVKTIEDELDVTLAKLRQWERAPANPAALEQSVSFAFTTYRLKKKSDFLKNVRKAIEHGLSEEKALAALTTVPAQVCGVEDRTGTLETGKLANFLICDGNIFDKETTVYSTWTAGRKTEFVSLDKIDFRGEYDLKVGDLDLKLKMTNKLEKLKGTLSEDSVEIKLTAVSAEDDKLNFTAPLDKAGIVGFGRFTGRLQADTVSGTCVTIDSGTLAWQAVRTAPRESKNDLEDTEPVQIVSRLTYPNIGYGTEQLPLPENVLIKSATVWTCEGDYQPEVKDVLVVDGMFEKIGVDLEAPSGVTVIDARGKHLTPGIIDEHSHIACSGDINEGTLAVTPEVRIGDIINSKDINVYRALAGGTTIVHTLHGSANPIGGQCQVIKLRWGASPELMKYENAPPTMKWALGENVKQCNWGEQFTVRYPQSRMGVETIIKDALQAAVEYERDWETYDGLRKGDKEKTVPPRRDMVLEPLLEVIQSRMSITCHSYHQSEILMLMRLAENYGFKINTLTHILEGYKVATEMAEHGAGAGSAPDWWAYKFEVYDAIPYNQFILGEHGVVTCINSDSPELGRRLNQEAAKSIIYGGMAPAEALKMVTINPAKLLHIDQWVGSIKTGKEADFVLWTGNPLSIYSHPEQTWLDGCKYFDVDQDQLMRESMQQERAQLIQKALTAKKESYKKTDYSSDYHKGGTHAVN